MKALCHCQGTLRDPLYQQRCLEAHQNFPEKDEFCKSGEKSVRTGNHNPGHVGTFSAQHGNNIHLSIRNTPVSVKIGRIMPTFPSLNWKNVISASLGWTVWGCGHSLSIMSASLSVCVFPCLTLLTEKRVNLVPQWGRILLSEDYTLLYAELRRLAVSILYGSGCLKQPDKVKIYLRAKWRAILHTLAYSIVFWKLYMTRWFNVFGSSTRRYTHKHAHIHPSIRTCAHILKKQNKNNMKTSEKEIEQWKIN